MIERLFVPVAEHNKTLVEVLNLSREVAQLKAIVRAARYDRDVAIADKERAEAETKRLQERVDRVIAVANGELLYD